MDVGRYVKIGIFFISLTVAGTGYVLMSTDSFGTLNTKIYEVALQDATGLSTNSKVFLSGVAVGKIRSIELDGSQAVLRVAFHKDVDIYEDAEVSRRSSSILGTSMLVLDPGNPLRANLASGGRIQPSAYAGDMGSLMGSAQDLAGGLADFIRDIQENQYQLIGATLESLSSFSQKMDSRLDAELDRVSEILISTASIVESVDRLMLSRETEFSEAVGDISQILANLNKASEALNRGDGSAGRLLKEDDAYEGLLTILHETEETLRKIQTGIDGAEGLIESTKLVVEDAGGIVSQASGLSVHVDTHSYYHFLASDLSAQASLYLLPRKGDRWYRLGVNTGSTIDVELARRFGYIVLRGGMLEGTAGLGIDVNPLDWASLSVEALQFAKGGLPNLRARFRLYPFFNPDSEKLWNWIYLDMGMREILSEERDFYFGAGLRFADSEVRGLIGLIPYAAK